MNIEQRWLLLHMGSWQIVAALCSPDGVTKMMQSCWGSSGGDAPLGAPAWLNRCGWDTHGSVITARGVDLKITAKDINRFAAQLPADVKKELLDCRNAGTANAVLRYRHCHCGDPKRNHLQKDAICPPTAGQERDATAEYWRVVDWQKTVLVKALGLGSDSWVDGDQLDLFEAAV